MSTDKRRGDIDALRAELAGELRAMREILTKELLDVIQRYIDDAVERSVADAMRSFNVSQHMGKVKSLSETVEKLSGEVKKMDATSRNDSALALTKAQTREIAVASSRQATAAALAEVKRVYAPRIQALSEAVAYHTQDTGELTTNYQMAVMQQGNEDRQRQITDGRAGSADLNPHRWQEGMVGMLWSNDETGM